ncbi:Ankyrin repeat and FYVE domain-containing protein 1 [Homalodisca vitripennis]|nr:Ankyrin repeat and FYVE domain-containing protein 1 [Homalodisca vitripennis]
MEVAFITFVPRSFIALIAAVLITSWPRGVYPRTASIASVGQELIAPDAEGKTPFHIAILNQHHSIISLLLCHPFLDLTIPDKQGLTPFATALSCRNNKAAQAVRDKLPTAAEQFDSKGRNFLHMAIQKNDVESVLFLLSIQVDVNSRVRDANQSSPLHLAAETGNELIVRSLLLAGARADDRDGHRRTALHVAAEAGHAAVVSALLQNGTDYDATDAEGDNALHVAKQFIEPFQSRVQQTSSKMAFLWRMRLKSCPCLVWYSWKSPNCTS